MAAAASSKLSPDDYVLQVLGLLGISNATQLRSVPSETFNVLTKRMFNFLFSSRPEFILDIADEQYKGFSRHLKTIFDELRNARIAAEESSHRKAKEIMELYTTLSEITESEDVKQVSPDLLNSLSPVMFKNLLEHNREYVASLTHSQVEGLRSEHREALTTQRLQLENDRLREANLSASREADKKSRVWKAVWDGITAAQVTALVYISGTLLEGKFPWRSGSGIAGSRAVVSGAITAFMLCQSGLLGRVSTN
jgi:hypothetical protein